MSRACRRWRRSNRFALVSRPERIEPLRPTLLAFLADRVLDEGVVSPRFAASGTDRVHLRGRPLRVDALKAEGDPAAREGSSRHVVKLQRHASG